ncbi:YezD family protein [Selenomonas ruminis]|nr:YezD family protein [Selenomonas sp. mPRGC5]
MAGRKLKRGEVPHDVMTEILRILQTISYGEVVLVAQDGILVQVEWNEKLRMDCFGVPSQVQVWSEKQRQHISEHVKQEFGRLQYGRLVIVVKRGDIVQMERTEKQRFTGLDGEGI